jgi:hypothetical protein
MQYCLDNETTLENNDKSKCENTIIVIVYYFDELCNTIWFNEEREEL